jgi:hypothetical protein
VKQSLETRLRARAEELERLALRGSHMDRGAREFAAREMRALLQAQQDERDAEAALIRREQESHGACPQCGGVAVEVSVGVVLNERFKGSSLRTSRPAPNTPMRASCREGHWWVMTDRGPAVCGPPEEVKVVHEPR